METPDLSSWDWDTWSKFCRSRPMPVPFNGRCWTYNPESDYFNDDFRQFQRDLGSNHPDAIALIPALVLWRMNNN